MSRTKAVLLIVFASNSVRVRIYYNAEWHYELDVSLERIAEGARSFSHSLSWLQSLFGPDAVPEDPSDSLNVPKTEAALDTALSVRAEQLRTVASGALSDD